MADDRTISQTFEIAIWVNIAVFMSFVISVSLLQMLDVFIAAFLGSLSAILTVLLIVLYIIKDKLRGNPFI